MRRGCGVHLGVPSSIWKRGSWRNQRGGSPKRRICLIPRGIYGLYIPSTPTPNRSESEQQQKQWQANNKNVWRFVATITTWCENHQTRSTSVQNGYDVKVLCRNTLRAFRYLDIHQVEITVSYPGHSNHVGIRHKIIEEAAWTVKIKTFDIDDCCIFRCWYI
jgi:hypothetical protein